jgi:hypothetical protein
MNEEYETEGFLLHSNELGGDELDEAEAEAAGEGEEDEEEVDPLNPEGDEEEE